MPGLRRRPLALLGFPALLPAAGAQPQLHFAEEGNWPPFTLQREGRTQAGLSYRLISEIGRRAGFSVQLDLMPQRRVLLEIAQGRFDGVTVISRNAERDALLLFSEPLFQKLGFVYFRRGEQRDWQRYEDLRELQLGVTRGHNLGEAFDRAQRELPLKVDVGGSDEQNFIKLIAGRVDAVFANHWSALFLLRQSRFQGLIERAPRPFFSKDYHLAISRKSRAGQALLPAINRAIVAMRQDGSLDALLVEHLDPQRKP
jgi:polar amino acid transport system substrate-binding protein